MRRFNKLISVLSVSAMLGAGVAPVLGQTTVHAARAKAEHGGIRVDSTSQNNHGHLTLTAPLKVSNLDNNPNKTITIPKGTKLNYEQDAEGVTVYNNKKYPFDGIHYFRTKNVSLPELQREANAQHQKLNVGTTKSYKKKFGNHRIHRRNPRNNGNANVNQGRRKFANGAAKDWGKESNHVHKTRDGLRNGRADEPSKSANNKANRNSKKGLPRTAEKGINKYVAVPLLIVATGLLIWLLSGSKKHAKR